MWLSLRVLFSDKPDIFVHYSKQVRCCRCLCRRVAYTALQLQLWWISEYIVCMVLQLQEQTLQHRSGAEYKSSAISLIHKFQTRFQLCCCETSYITLLTQTLLCLSAYISHNTKLSFIHTPPVCTAKHFTSCWCQGHSLYLFLSPQKSSLTPVFIIKFWLLGRTHLDHLWLTL